MTNFSSKSGQSDAATLVEAEALAWIAQLNGDDVSEKDLAAFRDWVNRSPAHQKEIKALSQLWTSLNALTVMDEPIRQADRVSKQLRKRALRRNWKRRIAVPALAGLVAVAGVVSAPLVLKDFYQNSEYVAKVNVPLVFKTEKGEHQTHSLEDGSVITLNTDSHIEVDFMDGQRDVRLLKGEALFTVAHDEKRPFLVFANNGIVRAVGTEFSVRITDNAIDVLVSEGSVELSTLQPTKPTLTTTRTSTSATKVASLGIIEAGHLAQVENSKASIEIVSNDVINAELSWRVGRLEFTGEGLEEAIAEYTRYTELNIIISDPELKDIHLGGSFPTGELGLFFKTLEMQFGIEVNRAEDNRVYLRKAK